MRIILRKDGGPLVATLVGISFGLPSVDFLALLAFIAKSEKPPLSQAVALSVDGGVRTSLRLPA
jgi:hypothetical protein